MKQWFPLTDYDFWAYLMAGMIVVAAADHSFGGGELAERASWTVPQIVFWTAVSYLIGQLIAAPSSAILEHLLFRRIFHAPVTIALGFEGPRLRERIAAATFANREYAPLPDHVRARIMTKASHALEISAADIRDPEAVFGIAFHEVRSSADAASRMDQFRNQYGFARNVAVAAAIAATLIAIGWHRHSDRQDLLLLVGSTVIAFGMTGRFLKFYAAYSREVLSRYSADQHSKEGNTSTN